MKNLRITEKTEWLSGYGEGDSIKLTKFEIRKDFDKAFIGKAPIAKELLDKGQVIETLNLREHAELLMNALNENYK